MTKKDTTDQHLDDLIGDGQTDEAKQTETKETKPKAESKKAEPGKVKVKFVETHETNTHKFGEGVVCTFDEDAAKQLIKDGKCKKVK